MKYGIKQFKFKNFKYVLELHIAGQIDKTYYSIIRLTDLYDLSINNIFLILLIEQIFIRYFLVSLFLCNVIVFFYRKEIDY